MNGFEFATANRVIFGEGRFADTSEIAAGFGKRVMLVTGGTSCDAFAGQLIDDLNKRGAASMCYRVQGEPSVATITQGLDVAREHGADVVIGLGGGSAIDAGKAIAGLLTNDGAILDYLEVVGLGKPLTLPALPMIAIPTTAGTGAEVTRNAVINVPDQRLKVSLRSPYLLPRVALVDPELTYTLPPDITASTGLDAITQLFESAVSKRATEFSRMLSLRGLKSAQYLETAYQYAKRPIDEEDRPSIIKARHEMAFASLLGGMALANSGLGAVHGFAAVLGARYPIPHGVCCGILLPRVVEANRQKLSDTNDEEFLDDVLHTLSPYDDPLALEYDLVRRLNMPTLSAFGVKAEDIPELVALAKQSNSMKGNPVELPDETLSGILLAAL